MCFLMAELQIVCLDGFGVTLAEQPLTVFQTDKTRALLVYLTIEGGVYQRGELAKISSNHAMLTLQLTNTLSKM